MFFICQRVGTVRRACSRSLRGTARLRERRMFVPPKHKMLKRRSMCACGRERARVWPPRKTHGGDEREGDQPFKQD